MKFEVGDRVKFLDDYGEGVVIQLLSENRVMLDIDEGIDIPVHESELILIQRGEEFFEEEEEEETETSEEAEKDAEPVDLSVLKNIDFFKRSNPVPSSLSVSDFANSLSLKVIDLHIEKLTDQFAGLSNSEMLLIQLTAFEKMMDEGIRGTYKRIVFVHGVGLGILKREIQVRLKTYKNIEFGDASEAEFGYGATEVHFID